MVLQASGKIQVEEEGPVHELTTSAGEGEFTFSSISHIKVARSLLLVACLSEDHAQL